MRHIFLLLASAVNIYGMACFLSIIMSWIPEARFSSVGKFLSNICDPYLNVFRRIRFLQIGMIDFSPIIGLGLISVVSKSLRMTAYNGSFSILLILGGMLAIIWRFVASIVDIVIVCFVVRLIYDLIRSASYSPFWQNFDRFLNPLISKILRIFVTKGVFSYRQSLIIALIITISARVILGFIWYGLKLILQLH